jgi:hypothetical protein
VQNGDESTATNDAADVTLPLGVISVRSTLNVSFVSVVLDEDVVVLERGHRRLSLCGPERAGRRDVSRASIVTQKFRP